MSFSIGLSGVSAATRRLDSAAFDVARASTQRTGQAAPSGPPQAAAPDAPAPNAPPPAGAAPAIGTPMPSAEDPDLPRAMVDMISASNAVLANLQTIRRADETLEAALRLR